MRPYLLGLITLFLNTIICKEAPYPEYVIGRFRGQLGNQLFQVACAQALAWDNGAIACFPDLDPQSTLYQHVFFRCNYTIFNIPKIAKISKRPVKKIWQEPEYSYQKIQYSPNIHLHGFFQSEKYFSHHRERIQELFAPHPKDLKYITQTYGWLLSKPNTVGVQLRYYRKECPTDDIYIQYGKDYLEKAMATFPETSQFIVSSNDLEFARNCIPDWAQNVIFLVNEPNYIDLHILSLCRHNIITNSSFGWWAAWLNKNPGKKVLRPAHLFNTLPTEDYAPPEWIPIISDCE